MNLNVFSGRDLQLFKAILQELEVGGVTSLAIARERLQDHLRQRNLESRRPGRVERNTKRQKHQNQRCPSCGKAKMVSAKGVTEPVLVCPACRYSEYSEVM